MEKKRWMAFKNWKDMSKSDEKMAKRG